MFNVSPMNIGMSSDDEHDFIMCEYCEDQRGLCGQNFLVDDRRFSIKLDENFEVDTVSHNDKSFSELSMSYASFYFTF